MSVTFTDFYTFAKALSASSAEIELRNSTSRAYYAAFHLAQTVMDRCPSNEHLAMGAHERVTERLHLQGSLSAKSLAYVLVNMKRQRKIADYEIADPFQGSIALAQIGSFEAFEVKVADFAKKYPPLP
ncbi:hypothetical protein [Herbaspirillum frisingense]|uniref:hypothetical protein n=1 Tax=Herbaspirillum frisingense TaxID=92645 RepID=UPI0039B0C3F0